MAVSLKELLVVLLIASLVFMLAKPIALTFTPEVDFKRRRRAWFALTILAFLSPNFWIFVAIGAPILVITGRKDSNPVAAYFTLFFVIPPLGERISLGGSAYLFALDNYMLLSLCIMTPLALRIMRARDRPEQRALIWMDLAMLGYGVLNAFQYLQQQGPDKTLYPITTVDSIRRIFIFVFIAYVPYFAASRFSANRKALADAVAGYCLAGGILSGVAIFESQRGWLLYGEMPGRLTGSDELQYLIREQALRAMASSGHPLALASYLSIAVPLWLCLRPRVQSAFARHGFSLLLGAGLLVTYSRGPWIGAAVASLLFVLMKPRAASAIVKTTIGILLAGAALSMTPIGAKIITMLPIVGGNADSDTIIYRKNLLDRSLIIIGQHPWIGDSTALSQMEDLRQGQGIIDLVNVYVQILLNDGIIGLTFMLGFIFLGLARANAARRLWARSDPDLAALGASLIASTVGYLVTLWGGSLGTGAATMYYLLGALAAAYAAIAATAPAPAPVQNTSNPVRGVSRRPL